MRKILNTLPNFIAVIAAVVLAVTLVALMDGCAFFAEHKDEIHAAIIEVAETKGQEAAVAYVDKLAAEGKLGSENAEKIKAAIPLGIEKLKETMNGEVSNE